MSCRAGIEALLYYLTLTLRFQVGIRYFPLL